MKTIRFAPILLAAVLLGSVFIAQPAQAANLADFQAGRIIDDSVFNNSTAMNVDQIQAFLNSKVPTCDNWGTQPYAGTTRRAYSEARGITFPLTCVKDYYENPSTHANNLSGQPIPSGALSAAQIIADASSRYSINPQVLIVLLQKEQGLTTDDWPWPYQYRSATGYGCPDSGAGCDATYYGFYNQVETAAWQFRHYAQNPNSFNFVPNQNNYVQYNPVASCGGSVVFVQNQATASLYNYTPYQPNASALAAGYGTGDSCGAYGNRNFWLYFSDWFGNPLINDPFGWDVIKTSDGRWWLVIGKTKRYISSINLYNDWGLDKKPLRNVSDAEANTYATLPDLGRLGWFGERYYYVDGGKKYWLSTDQLVQAWGQWYQRPLAAPAYTLLGNIPDGGGATYYITQTTENKVGFLDNGKYYSITPSEADRWQANPIALTADTFDNYFGQAGSVGYTVTVNGLDFIVDDGHLLDVTNPVLKRAYNVANATFSPVPGSISIFMRSYQATPTVRADGDNNWYRLLGGKKYFLQIIATAKTWGSGNGPTIISPKLMNSFTSGSTLLAIVHDPSTDDYYLVDDSVRHKLTGAMRDALLGGGIPYPDVDTASLNDLAAGSDISVPLLRNREQGHIYTINNGYTYHIPTMDVLHAYGSPRRYTPADVSADATYSLSPSFVPTSMFIANGSTTYFMQDGYAYPISSGAVNDWVGGSTAKDYTAPNFSSRFNVLTTPITQEVNELGHDLIASNGTLVDVGSYNDAYDNSSSWPGLVAFGMPRATGTYIVRSSDPNDVRHWLINQGNKYYIANLDQLSAYTHGFGIPITTLSPTALNLFSVGSGNPSLLMVTQSGGFKLLENDGTFYSFPNGDTAVNFIGNNRIENLSQSIANTFNRERKPITRLIRDPSGKIYWVENGQKRWILNAAALQLYSATPITDVSSGITNWLPDGAVIQ